MAIISTSDPFTALYQQYYEQIYKRALSILKDEMVAEELTQDSFLKLHELLQSGYVDASRSPLGLLYTIARNKAYNWLKHQKIIEEVPILGVEKSIDEAAGIVDVADSRDDYAAWHQDEDFAWRLRDLDQQERQILTLRYKHDYTIRETAKLVSLSKDKVNRIERMALNKVKCSASL